MKLIPLGLATTTATLLAVYLPRHESIMMGVYQYFRGEIGSFVWLGMWLIITLTITKIIT